MSCKVRLREEKDTNAYSENGIQPILVKIKQSVMHSSELFR